jgi:hypothetical protein
MHSKIPAIIFLVLGIIFISFSKQVIVGVRWLDKSIWTEDRRRRFPGHGGGSFEPWMSLLLGASWIACAIFFGSLQSDESHAA